jgi:hypothetical protein
MDVTDGLEGAGCPPSGGLPPLPCLRSNNSTGTAEKQGASEDGKPSSVPVATSAYKTEFCLKENIELAVEYYGIGYLAFFTPTFAKPVFCKMTAQKRLNSLLTHVIRPRYGNCYIAVFERHESGAIHFHFVLRVEEDIRTGFDWDLARQAYEAQKQRNFVRAGRLWVAAAQRAENGDYLRGEWKFWRHVSQRYRWLGRCEMLPIRSTAEAVAKYTGGYIAKHMQHRREEDKGVQLVRYGKGMHWVRSRLAFNSPKCWLWREKLKMFALQNGCGSQDAMKEKFGKRWAYHCKAAIQGMPLLVRIGETVVEASQYGAAMAQELCGKFPRVSDRHYHPTPLVMPSDAQALHEWRLEVSSLARSAFGESIKVITDID